MAGMRPAVLALILAACVAVAAPPDPAYDVRVTVAVRDTLIVFNARDFSDTAPGLAWSMDIIEAGYLLTDSLLSTTVAATFPLRFSRPMTFCAWVINERDTRACVKWPEDLKNEN